MLEVVLTANRLTDTEKTRQKRKIHYSIQLDIPKQLNVMTITRYPQSGNEVRLFYQFQASHRASTRAGGCALD